MQHICNAIFGGYEFGIAIDESVDNPGMFRLLDENDGDEIADMFESEQDALNAIFAMYPDNDL